MKKLNIKGLIKGLVREGLQAIPVVGTFVTNWKTNSPDSPEGKLKLGKWDFYRIIIGAGAAYALTQGVLTIKELRFVMDFMGF